MPHPELGELVGALDHRQGPDDAPATLVIYADFQCLHCGRAYGMLKTLVAELPGRAAGVLLGDA